MAMVRYWILMIAIASVVACSTGSENVTQTQVQQDCLESPDDSWRARYLALGGETYEKACASCHDKKVDGAPLKGDRESWSGRSPLWSAVLLEHARNGYLEMPPKGGQPGLSDEAVEAAGEYMLCETFPEMLRD